MDPHDSTFHVNIETGANDVVAALVGELGDRVTLTYSLGGPVSDVRQDDGEPHWGGAAIGLAGGGNYCTSGFTVDTQNSGKAMVTAGHCFRNGDGVTSGNEGYGTAQGESDYPTYDMTLINGPNQNYDDDIYHNPLRDVHDPVDVDGGRDADIGDYICASGQVSLAECGIEVTSLNAKLCLAGQECTPVLMESKKIGNVICQGGDSGMPMYNDPPNVLAHGIHIGRSDGSRRDICLAEKTSSIKGHLDVTVADTP